MLILLVLIMFLLPMFNIVDKELEEEKARITEKGDFVTAPYPPSKEDWFGTNNEGKDIFSMLVLGAKETIGIVLLVVLIRYIVAIPLAFLAANKKSFFNLILNCWKALFSGLPTIFSAMILMSIPFVMLTEGKVIYAILILAMIEVGRVSFILRSEIDYLMTREFVKASESFGANKFFIYKKHIIKHIIPAIYLNFFNDLSKTMVIIGQLGVLSIFVTGSNISYGIGGVESESYNWAVLIAQGRGNIFDSSWMLLYPALAFAIGSITFFLISNGLKKR